MRHEFATDKDTEVHVALFQHMKYGWYSVFEVDPNKLGANMSEDYVRVTEPAPANLRPLKGEEVMGHAVAAIDAQIKKVKDEAYATVEVLETRKREFLCITHQAAE